MERRKEITPSNLNPNSGVYRTAQEAKVERRCCND
jgi:hypothetical protein